MCSSLGWESLLDMSQPMALMSLLPKSFYKQVFKEQILKCRSTCYPRAWCLSILRDLSFGGRYLKLFGHLKTFNSSKLLSCH